MLHEITWKEYWSVIGVAVIAYYLWLLYRYFPTLTFIKHRSSLQSDTEMPPLGQSGNDVTVETQASATIQQSPAIHPAESSVVTSTAEPPPPSPPQRPRPIKRQSQDKAILDLSGDIKVLLIQTGKDGPVKEDLIKAIKLLLAKEEYKGFSGTKLGKTILDQIQYQAKEHCSIHFDNDELNGLWV